MVPVWCRYVDVVAVADDDLDRAPTEVHPPACRHDVRSTLIHSPVYLASVG